MNIFATIIMEVSLVRVSARDTMVIIAEQTGFMQHEMQVKHLKPSLGFSLLRLSGGKEKPSVDSSVVTDEENIWMVWYNVQLTVVS